MSAIFPMPGVAQGPPPPAGDLPPATAIADGDTAPGQGIRQLDDSMKAELLRLRQNFEGSVDGNRARREYVKKCLKLLEFFRGNQYTWWDYTTGSWRSTSASTGGQLANTAQGTTQSLYVMNFFQAYLLSLEALLTGNKMTVRAFPEDPQDPDDVLAAEKATQVAKAFMRADSEFTKTRKQVFALGICGTFGSYIRSVTDGDRFGYFEEPDLAMQDVTMGEPHTTCLLCGNNLNPPNVPGGENRCQLCAAPLPDEPEQPPAVQMPQQTGKKMVPRARTLEDIVDGFELKLPFDAADQSEFEMIVRSREVAKSLPRATWPEVGDQVTGGETGFAATGAGGEYERRVRRQSNLGTTTENRTTVTDDKDRVTLTEAWFRPRAFYNCDTPSTRNSLLQQFPRGVKVTWADDVFCEAREEEMDKAWRICHALPGRSQVREPIMASLVPVQEMANDILNIIRDVIEYTLPAIFISTRLLDVRKWARSQVMAGAAYPVADTGKPVGDGFHQTEPGQLPAFATTLLEQLRTEIAQFLTGAFPAAYGGGTGSNNTAQGIEIERQSALGRINLYLQALQEHRAEVAALVVEDFINNSVEPISFVDENEGGEMKLWKISPEDFAVGKYRSKFEVVSEFPTTWAQRQALTLQMYQMPALQPVVQLLKNASSVKQVLGTEMTIPKHDAYKREFRLINKILKGAPQPGPMQPVTQPGVDPNTGQPGMVPVMDPTTGQPAMQPGPQICSEPVTPIDDTATALEALADFVNSVDGQKALVNKEDPGVQNFWLHVAERQAAAAPPPDPNAPQGAAPAPPPA